MHGAQAGLVVWESRETTLLIMMEIDERNTGII
jgi:hypothetical protein